jgi:hypothetical protein
MGSDSVSIHQYDANFARVGQRKVYGLFFFGVGVSRLARFRRASGLSAQLA